MIERLRQKIAEGCAERAREDEGDPEQEHVADAGAVVQCDDDADDGGRDERALNVGQAGVVGQPVAEGSAEAVGKDDGDPVEGLGILAADRIDREITVPPVPDGESGSEARDKDQRSGRVAEAEGPVHHVGDFGAGGRRRDDRCPEESRVVAIEADLRDEERDQDSEGDTETDIVAEIERHRDEVAGSLAERGREDLHDPECQRDLSDLARDRSEFVRHREKLSRG